ncbi:DMT family transporter [Variovorax sp. PCZ-1]|uniref:DMT family transporter n=1 Tax=Variovorax sp. PCZ-1 TaxID=2835533 RepID=UPI001BCF0621|nr:DMT family transporter [Variovorax sp. PCZ-1]MBS7808262.1 DMT family transporter [Variovorax sp. PCZ-1]
MPGIFVIIWATGYVVARYGMPHAPPLSFLSVRYALSIFCFLVWIALVKAAWPTDRKQCLHLAVTGLLMHAGYLGGVWMAVKAGIGAGLSALIVNFQPVLTALWVAHVSRQQGLGAGVSRRQWAGLALGFIGLILVMSRKFGAGGEATAWNVFLCVIALLSMTTGALYQKRFVQPTDVRTANTIQLGAALLITLPFAFLETEPIRWFTASGAYNTPLLGAMAWSVLVLTLGGSSLLYLLIQRGAATRVTSLLYLVPPATALMAWALFGEAITALTLIGTAVTAAGVYLVIKPAATANSQEK